MPPLTYKSKRALNMHRNFLPAGFPVVNSKAAFISKSRTCASLALILGFSFTQPTFAQSSFSLANSAEKICTDTPIIGKVFKDKNKDGYADKGEAGIAGVRLYTAKGLQVTTDDKGRFHIACPTGSIKKIGSNFILKLDEKSLPSNHHLTSENPRVIRLTSSKTSKINFGIAKNNIITLEFTDAAFASDSDTLKSEYSGQLLEVINALSGQRSTLRITYHASANQNRTRIKALNTQIKKLWDIHGDDYDLNIERKTVWPIEN